jgi:endonuclease YncB( thermonuclease family)
MKMKNMVKSLVIKKIIIVFMTACAMTIYAHANELQKITVVKVADGDTVNVEFSDNVSAVRLVGIDCYETAKIHRAYRQAYENKITIEEVVRRGKEATRILEEITEKNKDNIYLHCEGVDKYGRILGVLHTDKININEAMKATGYCPTYMYNAPKTPKNN